jgi:hypothetical protein
MKQLKIPSLKQTARFAVKWTVLVLAAYWLLTTLVFGDESINDKTGMIRYRWSGVDALFTKERFGLTIHEPVIAELKGADGPYVVGGRRYAVSRNNSWRAIDITPGQALNVEVGNADQDQFQFKLRKEHAIEADTYPMPKRLIAISDIEGNFDAFQSFLVRNGVMDSNYAWTYGDGHLVLNGDFVDRGDQVSQVLWLIYKLEDQAQQHGGKVHFILGNHEIMNMQGNASYADMKYIAAAQKVSGLQSWNQATQFLYSEQLETGLWLRSKNVAEKIGPYVFVHGGLNTAQVEVGLTLPEMNQIARRYYGSNPSQAPATGKAHVVLNHYLSPYWDRSLSMDWLLRGAFLLRDPVNARVHRTTPEELDKVLAHFGAETVVIGHTVVGQVQADYGGKVIKMDVKHGRGKGSPQTQGVLIENGKVYRVDGLGARTALR